ncbi:hypothetical protein [Streptomyces zingiberis]|uniref:hypothetical protein n=1 Tax=Streptomyces zingiberis TaxID=2053010 RepID=UPI0019D07F26|nr:hypothetical protein [Streptomyces zingiberis]
MTTRFDDEREFGADDPLAVLLRPPADPLTPPPGHFETVRRSASRRRLLRTAAVTAVTCAVGLLAVVPVRLMTPEAPTVPAPPMAPPPASSRPAPPSPEESGPERPEPERPEPEKSGSPDTQPSAPRSGDRTDERPGPSTPDDRLPPRGPLPSATSPSEPDARASDPRTDLEADPRRDPRASDAPGTTASPAAFHEE